MQKKAPSATAVTKGFVIVRGRLVHYVRHGEGPVLVLLHASPCSAKVMAPLQARWGSEFTTFAFDLPGFGLSEVPDAEEITIPLLAEIIMEAMDALNIEDAAVYGRHTGASVALEIALARQDRTSLLLTDGLPVFSNPYSEERLQRYLPPITPTRDGLHLVWAYYRYREQHMFWPWDMADLAHRADADLPDAAFLHRGALELLEARNTYARVYRSAFLYRSLDYIGGLKIPAYYGNRPGDSQYKTIPLYPDSAKVVRVSREHDAAANDELAILRQHPAQKPAPAVVRQLPCGRVSHPVRDYISTRHGDVQAYAAGLDKPRIPVLYLHELPGGFELHLQEIGELAADRPVFAFDLGGNSESLVDRVPDVDLWLEQIEDVCAALGLKHVEISAIGSAAPLALAFAARRRDLVSGVILRSPPLLTAEERAALATAYAPDITPSEDGSHYLRLWHHLRDQELWWPWFDKSHQARRSTPPRIDPEELTRRAVILLKQPELYAPIWHEVLGADTGKLLSECPVPVQICSEPSDIFAFTVERRGGPIT